MLSEARNSCVHHATNLPPYQKFHKLLAGSAGSMGMLWVGFWLYEMNDSKRGKRRTGRTP